MAEGPSPKKAKYDEEQESYDIPREKEEKGETSPAIEPAIKSTSNNAIQRLYRRKCIILLSYSGKGYMGMQRNPGVPTIEDELIEALTKAEAIPENLKDDLVKMQFQRCARTDKGVSAARQVVSIKMVPDAGLIPLINGYLPDQIRVMGVRKVTKGFNSKTQCTSRVYEYLLPTYSFAPFENTNLKYRINATVITQVQKLLNCYIGSHNFHNFTKQKTYEDPSSKRYIMRFDVDHPFVRGDVEFVALTVEGQSFMIHQIRKMIGFIIAIVRQYIKEDTMTEAFNKPKLDIPRAPALGLYLDSPQFEGYNRKYGNDGVHESLDWSEYEDAVSTFKENYIHKTIIDTEIRTLSMLRWLETLHLHDFHQTVFRTSTNDKPTAVEATGTDSTDTKQDNKTLEGNDDTSDKKSDRKEDERIDNQLIVEENSDKDHNIELHVDHTSKHEN